MTPVQQALFDSAALPLPTPAGADRETLARQRWWRLKGRARRDGRVLEPVLVTPHLLSRIDASHCPVTRTPLDPRAAQVVALRDDAAIAAGHLATLSRRAAAVRAGGWPSAWSVAERLDGDPGSPQVDGLGAAEWRRLAVLRSFVQAPTPAQAAALPLHALPPPRLRVLSPVQSLQVTATLALATAGPARLLSRLAALAPSAELRDALNLFVLTLVARRPAGLSALPAQAQRQALEDLWDDPLLARRWQRLASRLSDAVADELLRQARQRRLLGAGWRLMDAEAAVDGWELAPHAPGRQVS